MAARLSCIEAEDSSAEMGRATVSGVEVQLVAVPAHFVALGIALRAALARPGDVLTQLRQGLLAFAMNARDLLAGARSAPRRGRPRLRAGATAVSAGLGCAAASAVGAKPVCAVGVGVPAVLWVRTGRSRASMALPSRLMCPINASPRCSLISVSCTRSAKHVSVNSSNAREKVAYEGSRLHSANPQIRRRARSIVKRSMSPAVVVSLNTALATKAFASQARSCGGGPTPHQLDCVNSSIRTHSTMWMTFSSFGVSGPTSFLNSGSTSY